MELSRDTLQMSNSDNVIESSQWDQINSEWATEIFKVCCAVMLSIAISLPTTTVSRNSNRNSTLPYCTLPSCPAPQQYGAFGAKLVDELHKRHTYKQLFFFLLVWSGFPVSTQNSSVYILDDWWQEHLCLTTPCITTLYAIQMNLEMVPKWIVW